MAMDICDEYIDITISHTLTHPHDNMQPNRTYNCAKAFEISA